MTKAEKLRFLADRVEDEKEFYINGFLYRYQNKVLMQIWVDNERNCRFNQNILLLDTVLLLDLELKPQWEFTEDEKVILRNLPNEFQWIARDKTCDGLFVYALKPTKSSLEWDNSEYGIGDVKNLNIFKHLFESIQWSDDEPCEFRKYI